MKRILIKNLLDKPQLSETIIVKGWIRTKRDYKGFSFFELNDGSSLKSLQIVIDHSKIPITIIQKITTGAAISAKGIILESKGKGQTIELNADEIEIYGLCDASYPLQKKGHTLEFLREIAHLRPRSNLFGSVFRLRSRLAYAIHNFFQNKDFFYIHTPIITSSDCEGAGELFKVTTFDFKNIPFENGEINYKQDFFGKPTFLTVSGQLEGELFATALSNIYTFGPTFRAENSNTQRHVSEFWMIEPEMAFCDIYDNMNLAEEFIKAIILDVLEYNKNEIELFNNFVDKTLQKRLISITENIFHRISYEEALDILIKSKELFEFPIYYGMNLQTEHERYLTEMHFKSPVIVYNYPKEIKPFYMRLNNDNKTVAAMDILVPGIGEIIGGSQREERLNILLNNIELQKLNKKEYEWYIDTRRFGSAPHSGFGLGFERMLMLVTGISNIRDVIPFARTPKNAMY